MKTRNITNVMMVAVVAATLGMGVVQPAAAQTLPYTTGLDVWFDASDMNGNGDNNSGWSNGDTLSTSKTWVNKGSAGNPVSYAYRTGGDALGSPVYRAAVTYPVGGTGPAVEFTRDNFRLPEFMDSPNLSIFAVVQRISAGGTSEPILFDYGSTASQLFSFKLEAGNVSGYVRDSSNNILTVAGTSNIATSVAIVEMFMDGANQTMEAGPLGFTALATNALYSTSTTWSGTYLPPVVGTFTGHVVNNHINGNIFELLIFDHVVTGANRTAVENYLTRKYIFYEPPPAGTVFIIK